MSKVRSIGLDVHKDTIVIAMADEGRGAASVWKTIPYDEVRLAKSLELLRKPGGALKVCYEAGPTGYGIHRRLTEAGIDCQVVAPSLIPTQAGNRVKTDRRDAKRLAHFHRSGDLTPIYVPDEAVEALRDLERAREDSKRSETAARHQLGKFLLRHSRRYTEGNNWTCRHVAWIRRQQIAWRAQHRLHRRLVRLKGRGKDPRTAVTAVARELAGFIWAIGQEDELLASSNPTAGPRVCFQNKGKGSPPTERAAVSNGKSGPPFVRSSCSPAELD